MNALFSRAAKSIVAILSVVGQVANLFLGNILVDEATENHPFNWLRLLKNPIFWTICIITIVYYCLSSVVNHRNRIMDEKVENAISESKVEIIQVTTDNVKKEIFETADKAIRVLDKMQRRSRK